MRGWGDRGLTSKARIGGTRSRTPAMGAVRRVLPIHYAVDAARGLRGGCKGVGDGNELMDGGVGKGRAFEKQPQRASGEAGK